MSMQDHYCAQPVQEAQEYMPYQERVEAIPFQPEIPFQAMQPMVPEVPANDEADPPVAFQSMIPMVPQVDFVAEIPGQRMRPARPAVLPRRAQPLVTDDHCLKHYLTQLYQKRINLSDADKFLTTFKNQKPKQTCSNFLDEFIIHYENYAHMKWTIEELDGIEAVEGVEADPRADPPVEEVIAVEGREGNQLLRNAEMIQLATDVLCREFKIHCDNTNVNLRNIDFPTLEVEVQHWQRNTTTGKTFTAACTPANHGTKHANVSALELSDYFDMDKNNPPDNAETSAATTSNRGQRGGRGNRGSERGARGRGGRNMSCQQTKPSIQSKDVQDGGFNNYKQTPDGKVILSPQGHPLCNYCGTPSHKRESCGIKRADRAAGLTRTVHPDRDNPRPKSAKSTSAKAKTSEATIAAAAQGAHTQQYPPPYPIVQWNYPVAIPQQQPMDPWQQQLQKGQNIQALIHAARMEHEQGTPNTPVS